MFTFTGINKEKWERDLKGKCEGDGERDAWKEGVWGSKQEKYENERESVKYEEGSLV